MGELILAISHKIAVVRRHPNTEPNVRSNPCDHWGWRRNRPARRCQHSASVPGPPFTRFCPVARPFLPRHGAIGQACATIRADGLPGNAPDTFAEPGDTRIGLVLDNPEVSTA